MSDSVRNKRQFCKLCTWNGYSSLLKWGREQGCPWDYQVCQIASRNPSLFPLLKWAFENGAPLSNPCMLQAARGGSSEVLEWLLENGCNWNYHVVQEAAMRGHLHLLEWLEEKQIFCKLRCPRSTDLFETWTRVHETFGACATNGNLQILEWLVQHGVPLGFPALAGAIRGGHLHILEWLKTRLKTYDWIRGVEPAAREGNIEVLEFLYPMVVSGNLGEISYKSCSAAAKSGSLETLQWLRGYYSSTMKLEWDFKTTKYAAKYGHLHILRWAVSSGCPVEIDTFIAAAKNGNIEMLEYLQSIDCAWGKQVANAAAKFGHLEALNWLHENGCPWDDLVYWNAVLGGTKQVLPILNWARLHGCQTRDSDIFEAAARSKAVSLELITWLIEHKFPYNHNTCIAAAKTGNLNLLKFLIKRGFPWKRDLTTFSAAAQGHMHVLKWLVDNDCPYPTDDSITQFATRFRNLEMLQWAKDHGCSLEGNLVLCNVWENGDIAILNFFLEHTELLSRSDYMEALANYNNWNCIQWVVSNKGFEISDFLIFSILERADPRTITWLHDNAPLARIENIRVNKFGNNW